MTWTTAKPTVPGWYWWRCHDRRFKKYKEPQIVQVESDREGLYAEGFKVTAPYWIGEWFGPLERRA